MNESFISKCKTVVRDYYNQYVLSNGLNRITSEDVCLVMVVDSSFCGGHVVLRTIPFDGTYYELTLNCESAKLTLDIYKKSDNRVEIDYLAINGDS